MEFYVIYSVDCLYENYLNNCRPRPELCEKLTLTEEGESEYRYLEGQWEEAVHEKWAGILSKADFEKFLYDTFLTAEDCETLGSLTEYGWMPAIPFNADDEESICNAYVTPLIPGQAEMSEAQWERLRSAVIHKYKDF
jgi:hypothetical protein